MGYRGKVVERERARGLRAQAWTLQEIADELGVAKGSVSVWVHDVEFSPRPRMGGRRRAPNALQRAKTEEIARLDELGRQRLGQLSDQAFLAAGAALYAGEGGKTKDQVTFTNADSALVAFFCRWLRHHFDVDESRLRVRLYLHDGLDLDAAVMHWSAVTGVPPRQFGKAYRAAADPSIRRSKHAMGCATVVCSSSSLHREVMGLVRALLSSETHLPG